MRNVFTVPHCLYGCFQGSVTGHHHHFHIGIVPLDMLQKLKAVASGKDHIEEGDIHDSASQDG
jgi:hypothetical protein